MYVMKYYISMRFQRALEIINLTLAPAAVISAKCISRNYPTRYPFTSPGLSVANVDQCFAKGHLVSHQDSNRQVTY